MIGDVKLAHIFSWRLFEEKIFAMAIGYPIVSIGKARIRVMISAAHSREDPDFALNVFEKLDKELGMLQGNS